jgi:hypothetical protein
MTDAERREEIRARLSDMGLGGAGGLQQAQDLQWLLSRLDAAEAALSEERSRRVKVMGEMEMGLAAEKAKRAEGLAPLLQEIDSVRRDLQLEVVLREKISTGADSLARELAAKNERLEYLEGQDRSLLEQHQASMITLGDSDLLAVGGRLLDRAEKAEAKLAEKEAELELAEEHIGWLPESTYQAQGAELEGVKEQNAVLTAEAGRLREALGIVSSSADDCMLSHGENLCCIREAGLVRIAEEALSPEPEKPAPDGEGRKMP